ncbi:MAG: hypothetical protein ACRDGA_07005 [Bacteroidota bacterium]
MKIPGFTADACFVRHAFHYRGAQPARPYSGGIVSAIPFCDNCDEILDRCAQNGFRPRAVCYACLTGDCFSGVEKPPQLLQDRIPPRFW